MLRPAIPEPFLPAVRDRSAYPFAVCKHLPGATRRDPGWGPAAWP